MYDIIIIGAGPAGLTSALYALRANKKVLILEAKSYGGQIINASKIENYPGIEQISGFEYATNLYNQIIKLGAEVKYETVIKVYEEKKVITNKNEYSAKAVIIATGRTNKKLNLENETKFIGNGVSYCATCDGNFYKNKKVAVIGGGNTAIDDALYLSNIASKVYLIHRSSTFKAFESSVQELKNKSNVEFILDSSVKSLNGEEYLESITLNNDKIIEISGIFIAIGQEAKNEIFSNVVDIESNGYFKTIDDVHTKTPGIYIAGDARCKDLRQLTTAVSDGAIAAMTAIKEN